LLAELFRQELGDQTRDDVGRAPRGLTDDDFHRTRGIGLRARAGGEHRGARRQMQELSTGKFHDGPRNWRWTLRLSARCERFESDRLSRKLTGFQRRCRVGLLLAAGHDWFLHLGASTLAQVRAMLRLAAVG